MFTMRLSFLPFKKGNQCFGSGGPLFSLTFFFSLTMGREWAFGAIVPPPSVNGIASGAWLTEGEEQVLDDSNTREIQNLAWRDTIFYQMMRNFEKTISSAEAHGKKQHRKKKQSWDTT